MAKTLIGEIILKMQDNASSAAKNAASNITSSMDRIEKAARTFNLTSWGGRFESQLQKLGASSKDLDRLRESWNRLNGDIQRQNLGRAMANQQLSNFKVAALNDFAAVKNGWDKHSKAIESRTKSMANSMKNMLKPVMVALGGYTGAYLVGVAGKDAISSSAAWEREKFRGRMAGIPKGEQDQLLTASEGLGSKYPSVNITDIAEMARNARAMMGTSERAIAILPEIVRGFVALQSVKGVDTAQNQMVSLLRGIDNAGQNKGGQLGIDQTREIIAGIIRASQTDSDVDPGKLFQFARRGKIAVPGLSTKFLATAAPAFMQDMTPEGFGASLSSAYQALVIGSNAVASKQNIAYQRDIGIRNDKGLVGDKLFGADPYAWVKSILVPALTKAGVDMGNDTDVAQAVAKISRNTNATALLTRMVTQQGQVDRSMEQYANSQGPEAGDVARFNDPFVAYKGFIESLRNLAAAVGEDTMPTITAGLNSLTNGINSMSQLWRDGGALAKGSIIAGGAAAGYGAYKTVGAIWGLITAGTNLNAAAVSLQAAAVSLGGSGVVQNAGKKGILASIAGWAGGAATSPVGAGLIAGASAVVGLGLLGRDATRETKRPAYRDYSEQYPGDDGSRRYHKMWDNVQFEGGMHRAGLGAGPKADFQDVVSASRSAGQEIQTNLNVTASPKVDTSSLERAAQLVSAIKSGLVSINAGAGSVRSEMNRNFADHGVSSTFGHR